MKYLLLALCAIVVFCSLAYAAKGDKSPGILATYSSAKTSACVRGSIAHSKTQLFVCYTTGKWKKSALN